MQALHPSTEPTVTLPRGQVEALLQYLVTKPFGEVANACGWLQSALAQPQPQPTKEV